MPWGDASERIGDSLSARSAWQVPVLVDVGFKLGKPWLLGLYAGVSFGSVGSGEEAEAACGLEAASCGVAFVQVGVQAQYHFGPSDQLNPWLGFGFGYESLRQSLSAPGYREVQETSGVTLLKLSSGLDYRMWPAGLGPFVEGSFGRFAATRTLVNDKETHRGPVDPSAWHGTLVFGVRLVIAP